jgi:deferrochelatase/peroxidase EfeB
VILFARDVAERDRCQLQHRHDLSTLAGVKVLSALNLEALPPFDGVPREHFGYRDRLSQPVIEETGEQPTPGSGPAVKAGEFFLGYADESGSLPPLPQPEVLSRNGSYLAYLRMEEHVGVFRQFLRQQAPDQQELLAAKLMGRWRSGAPLVLSPDKDDPSLGGDLTARTTSCTKTPTRTDIAARSAATSGA